MITIKKSESIELYQLKLTLKEKVKQNPFIAVLMLAQELFDNESEYINSEILREKIIVNNNILEKKIKKVVNIAFCQLLII